MSVSFTNARILILLRSAIWRIVVPPLAAVEAEVITVPTETGRRMIVPFVGAVTVASSNWSFAVERFVRALMTAASAFAKASVDASLPVAGMILCWYRGADRLRCASATALATVDEARSAAAWVYAF